MRVLLVSGSFPPIRCGVGDYTAKLAHALAEQDETDVSVLTRSDADRTGIGRSIEFLSGADEWRLSEVRRIAGAVRRWSPDIIHFQYPCRVYGRLQWVLPALFGIMGYPVFLTLHEYYGIRDFRSMVSAALLVPSLLYADGIVVTRSNHEELVPSFFRRIFATKTIRHIPIASNIPTAVLDDIGRIDVRLRYGATSGKLVSFFGFVSRQKGVESLFDVADPEDCRLSMICDLAETDPYQRMILGKTQAGPWDGKVHVTGFLPDEEVGRLLAASDAVLLPFRDGVNIGNGSLHAALAQGTYTVTTSRDKRGYDSAENVYYAQPGDIAEMRTALREHIGERIPRSPDFMRNFWRNIADAHVRFYSSIYARRKSISR